MTQVAGSRAAGSRAAPRSRRGALLLVCATLAAAAIFAALGVWQVERRAWKLQLIASIDQRIHAAPVDAPGPAGWPAINAADDAYRRVRVRGVFWPDRDTLVQAVTILGGGYWVLTPLVTDRGFTVLVNRGFVPPDRRRAARRPPVPVPVQAGAEVEVTGLLRITEPKGGFLRQNDPADDRWYSRDVAAIARYRDLGEAAPYFIDSDSRPGEPDGPVGGLTIVNLPNNHLVYALTWFGLAALALAASAITPFQRGVSQARPEGEQPAWPTPMS